MIARTLLFVLVISIPIAPALASERDDVERIVVVGDVHGDYNQFETILRDAGVIDKRNRWRAGKTHLVQIGDLPDRGPDTHLAIKLLKKLERAAKKAGGEVHAMIGNHETMVMRGDLRYVHPGEYAALTDRRSEARQQDYYDRFIAYQRQSAPEGDAPTFDDAYRQAWNTKYPLGWVEHRRAWAADGEFGAWVREHDALLRIDDTLFVHGGLNPDADFVPIADVNRQILQELEDAPRSDDESIINRADSPLWYRGLAVMPETEQNTAKLDAMLAFYGVKRIVIAHTPLLPTIVPRFGGKVLLADVGMSAHYGSGRAALVIVNGTPSVVLNGEPLELPPYGSDAAATESYLQAAAEILDNPERVDQYLEKQRAGSAPQ